MGASNLIDQEVQKLSDLIIEVYKEAEQFSLMHAASLHGLPNQEIRERRIDASHQPMISRAQTVHFPIFSIPIPELFTSDDAAAIHAQHRPMFSEYLSIFQNQLGTPNTLTLNEQLWEDIEPQLKESAEWRDGNNSMSLTISVDRLEQVCSISALIQSS
ncbi:hypothetical protein [Deinococcus sp. QL22]|uniref:hypothetical protein n=1 Tax=Deinococcus sp. QL22 TaxID=2939437 RepID=UPI002016D063|nr:hypothetical protein [Deinococcus sp. QL22]UQN05530.1 hypothetical protein M1R55_11655 [Deinococcus sp. QL22]